MGRVWRLDTGGPAYAVKELLWGAGEAEVRAEVTFRDAATAMASIEAPASHRTIDGRYLWTLPAAAGAALVRGYDWADGAPVTTPDADAAGWLGRTLAALHSLGHPCPDRSLDPWYWRCPTGPDWMALRADAAGATWTGDLDAALPRLAELTALVAPEPGPPWIWCHRDLQPSNVLIHGSGPDRRYTLLDWENAGPASPDRELAACLLGWRVDDAGTGTTMDAYHRAGGPVRSLTPASFSMAIAAAVNYVYVQARASLDPELSADDRDHANQRCAAALASLPAPDLLDAILAATVPR
jgi:Ser/Thr protein kinase RdoA (MazF antagonist)